MSYSWENYRGYLSQKITEAGIFVEGYDNQQLVNAMIDQAEARGHEAIGKSLAETFVFESLTYGIKGMAERTGLEVKQYSGPELVKDIA